MKQSLILYLDETWPTPTDCPWVVLDSRNQVVEQGFSAPQHWPSASSCTVILGGGQCVQHTVRLPKGGRREEQALLRYALEEKLVGDVEHQHFTIIDRSSDDEGPSVTLLVIAKPRLRQLNNELEALGRSPDRVISELQIPPTTDKRWTVSISPTGTVIVSVPKRHTLVVDPEILGELLSLLQQQARASDELPERLSILRAREGSARQTELPALPDDVPVEDSGAYVWWDRHEACDDLLHGSFAVSGRNGGLSTRLRLPALGIAAAILILLGANIIEVGVKRQELNNIEERMQRIFETSVPGTPAIAPVAQLRREVDQQLGEHGQLRHDDFLQLLDIATETAGTSIRGQIASIDYADGVLRLGFVPGGGIDLGLLAARLGASGLRTEPVAGSPNSLTLSTRRAP